MPLKSGSWLSHVRGKRAAEETENACRHAPSWMPADTLHHGSQSTGPRPNLGEGRGRLGLGSDTHREGQQRVRVRAKRKRPEGKEAFQMCGVVILDVPWEE